MALRDHSLDDKITSAAMEEFSEKGYMGASLRKIAQKSGATVGAIQTRYRSKDELFASLLKPFLDDIEAVFQNVRADYYSDIGGNILELLRASMLYESQTILRLIFDHYSEAVLLLYRSGGSSLEHYFDMLVENKIKESVMFFNNAGYSGVDEKILGLLISMQFDSYRRIVMGCSDRAAAEKYMQSLMTYHLGGWVALFDSISEKNKQGDMRNEI